MELAANVRSITAIDLSSEAIAYLKNVSKRRGITNINPLHADAESFSGVYDILVLSFFGRPGAGLKRLIDGARRGSIIMTHGDDTDTRRSALGEGVKKIFAGETRSFLNRESIPYEERAVTLEFGQPFLSEADATRYFNLYRRTSGQTSPPALIGTKDPRFPLYYPKQRSIAIFQL
jgi:hypothetical protein